MKRLSKSLILIAILVATEVHAFGSAAWPFDEFVTPSFNCLDEVAPESHLSVDSLFSRCLGLESTTASLWALARYYRASTETRSPSPLVDMAYAKLFHYLNPQNIGFVRKVLVTNHKLASGMALSWILRLDMEVDQIKTAKIDDVKTDLHSFAVEAAEYLLWQFKESRHADNSPTLNNWAWLLWHYHAWAQHFNIQSLQNWSEKFILNLYRNSNSCLSTTLVESFSVSQCFLEILAVKSSLPLDEFKPWLKKQVPDPRAYAFDDYDGSQTGSIKNLGLAPSRLLVMKDLSDQSDPSDGWYEAYTLQLKSTLENLPLWRENQKQAVWLGPLSIMALTSDFNRVGLPR